MKVLIIIFQIFLCSLVLAAQEEESAEERLEEPRKNDYALLRGIWGQPCYNGKTQSIKKQLTFLLPDLQKIMVYSWKLYNGKNCQFGNEIGKGWSSWRHITVEKSDRFPGKNVYELNGTVGVGREKNCFRLFEMVELLEDRFYFAEDITPQTEGEDGCPGPDLQKRSFVFNNKETSPFIYQDALRGMDIYRFVLNLSPPATLFSGGGLSRIENGY